MRIQPLNRSVPVTLDGSGAGTAALGPALAGEVWTGLTAAVSASGSTKEATARIYAGGGVSAATFVDGTTWGSTGDSTSQFGAPVYPGQQVFAVWAGGDPGAIATLVITGTRQVP
jgi:hypothetical protein